MSAGLPESGAPEPLEPEVLTPSLIRVPVRTYTLPPATRTNMCLVRSDRGWYLVDPGSASEAENARAHALLPALVGGWQALRGVILTHHHRDHVDGVGWWLARHPELPVVAHPRTPALLLRREWARRARWCLVMDEEVDGVGLLSSPGHASDHLALRLPEGGPWLLGDVIAGIGSILINPPDGDMASYVRTLEVLARQVEGAAQPAHGPLVEGASSRLLAYRAHRLAREAAVQGVLEGGGRAGVPLDVLVSEVWADVPWTARPMAIRAAQAHLEKLRGEGRARRSRSGRWEAVRGG